MDIMYSFKFLGMYVTSDGDDKYHIDKRKTLAIMSAKELDKLGLKNSLLDPEIKGLMLQSLVKIETVLWSGKCNDISVNSKSIRGL